MNAIVLLLAATVIFLIAYTCYGAWLAKKWGIDPKRRTPAFEFEDGVDYVPSKTPVVFGHHFASIAGAGPINGAIQAAIFGWLPVALWIIVGGLFFGAAFDFASIFASLRHKGKSIGFVIERNIGVSGKKIFLWFALLTLILVVAAFADIVADTFVGFTAEGAKNAANGSTAMTSVLFIFLSVIFGFILNRSGLPLWASTIIGLAGLVGCIALGLAFPIYISKTVWLVIIFLYIFIAATAPMWILLQPRDYLNSFLLYGTIIAAFVGILFTNPTIHLPAFAGFTVSGQYLFPVLFVTVACGAISGFHCMVGSGSTSKQLMTEGAARPVGYGGMLVECIIAIISLITVGALAVNGQMPEGTPPVIFATAISQFVERIGLSYQVTYTLITLAISTFALTSLDTCVRLARYCIQDLMLNEGDEPESLTGMKKMVDNRFVATGLVVVASVLFISAGYKNIWPLFGSANQLLAGVALLALCVWLGRAGKKNSMLILPMCFMLVVTICMLGLTIFNNFNGLFVTGAGTLIKEGLQIIVALVLIILAVAMIFKAKRSFREIKQQKAQRL